MTVTGLVDAVSTPDSRKNVSCYTQTIFSKKINTTQKKVSNMSQPYPTKSSGIVYFVS